MYANRVAYLCATVTVPSVYSILRHGRNHVHLRLLINHRNNLPETLSEIEQRPFVHVPSSVSVRTEHLSALLDSLSEFCQDGLGVVPANASVSNADTVLQTGFPFLGNLLRTCRPLERVWGIHREEEIYSPSLMWLSIMTLMIAVSPLATCSASAWATLG